MATVSVVIPAFNPGRYLALTLESLTVQEFQDWEAVVVDDGSTEDLSWVAELDERITLVQQSNHGLSYARNAAIARTSSPLVAFLDADDIWLPKKLAQQVAVFEKRPGVALVSTRFELIDNLGGVIGSGFEGHHDSYEALLQACGICVSTVVVRRAALDQVGLFDLKLRGAQDWDLWLRIAKEWPILRLEEVLARYRLHAGGMSRNWRLTLREAAAVLGQHDHPEVAIGLARAEELASYQAFDGARIALHEGRLFEVLKCLTFVALHQPALLLHALRRHNRSV